MISVRTWGKESSWKNES